MLGFIVFDAFFPSAILSLSESLKMCTGEIIVQDVLRTENMEKSTLNNEKSPLL